MVYICTGGIQLAPHSFLRFFPKSVSQSFLSKREKELFQGLTKVGRHMDTNSGTRQSVIDRTKSDQLEVLKSLSRTTSTETELSSELNGGVRRSNMVGNSPAKRSIYHIRKTRSTQLNMKVDLEEVSNAALSRASSASLGFSMSFTGFTPPPQDVGDLNHSFSDDDLSPGGDLESNINRKNFLIEPTLPLYLKFTDVKYKVLIKDVTSTTEKYILHGISGYAGPGEVVAMMGPSGSGKTSLLSILGGRVSNNGVEGSVTYNDKTYNKSLKRRIGFVTQDDVLFAHLTVKETLTYAALLLLPKTMTKQQKEKRAMDVIYELGLDRCQNTMIGGSFVRGVSGGERKRVCIGCEIIVNPSLLFLDEPTSGLDSTIALRIVQVMHNIAKAGKTVVTTIHQPSSRLFHKFDKLILLGKGSLLYYGKASKAMPYFESIGCSPMIVMNPAEFLLDLANGNLTDISLPSELHDEVQIKDITTDNRANKPSANDVHEYLVGAYENKVESNEKKILEAEEFKECEPVQNQKKMKREWGANWSEQYAILFLRGIKERRHDYLSWMRITQVIATALILGLLWWHSNTATPKSLQDQAGLLFFIAVFWGFFPVFTAIFTFPQERAMLNKERAVDMYQLSAYFMARTTSDLPLDLLLPVIFLLIVYFMAGLLQTTTAFFLTMLIVFLCIIAAQGLGLAIGATLLDIKKATTLASVTVMTFMLAGGFFVKSVPPFISWLRYLSFNYHTYRLLLKVQYHIVPPYLNVTNMDTGLREVLALTAMVFGYRLLAYISLRRTNLRSGS